MDPRYRSGLRRHYGRIAFALLAYYLITAAAQFAAQYSVLAWAPDWAESGWFLPALALVPMYCIGFPVFLLLLPKAPPRELLPERRSLPAREFFVVLLMCFGVLYPGNLLGQGLDWLIRRLLGRSGGLNALENLAGNSSTWAYVLAVVVLAPILEELTFRRLLLDRMRTVDKPSALVFSALAFALFHSNLIQFFYAFGVGLIFGCIYIRTGRVRYSMILHVLVNFFGSLAAFFLPEGGAELTKPLENLVLFLCLGVYALLLLAACVAGIVMFFRRRRSLRVADGADLLSPGSRFALVFCRPAWLLYCLAVLTVMAVNYLL